MDLWDRRLRRSGNHLFNLGTENGKFNGRLRIESTQGGACGHGPHLPLLPLARLVDLLEGPDDLSS